MRQLHPEVRAEVDAEQFVLDEARDAPPDRPWVFLNMVASVDGATASGGKSAGLGSAADRLVFHALRATADIVVAGAGTVRTEHYGPPRVAEHLQRWRVERGQAPLPRIAVVSGRLDLDLDDPFYREARARPIVITVAEAPQGRLAAVREVADVVVAGTSSLDLAEAFGALHREGARRVLVEGGPTLNGQLIGLGLVDELNLTLSPLFVGGDSHRIAVGGTDAAAIPLSLARLLLEEDQLFLRYLRA